MPLYELSLSTLKDLDGGRAAAMFDTALNRIIQDCADRPGDANKRTVTMKIDLVPITDATGQLDDIKLKVSVNDSMPKLTARSCNLMPQRRGPGNKRALLFNPNTQDARQGEFFPEEKQAE